MSKYQEMYLKVYQKQTDRKALVLPCPIEQALPMPGKPQEPTKQDEFVEDFYRVMSRETHADFIACQHLKKIA